MGVGLTLAGEVDRALAEPAGVASPPAGGQRRGGRGAAADGLDRFSPGRHHRSTVEQLARGLVEALAELIRHCRKRRRREATRPRTFPLPVRLDQGGHQPARSGGGAQGWRTSTRCRPCRRGCSSTAQYAPGLWSLRRATGLRSGGGTGRGGPSGAAWQRIVERHGVLRTSFVWQQLQRPQQIVWQRVELPWQEHDWRGLPPEEQQRRWGAVVARGPPPRLRAGKRAPLMRLTLGPGGGAGVSLCVEPPPPVAGRLVLRTGAPGAAWPTTRRSVGVGACHWAPGSVRTGRVHRLAASAATWRRRRRTRRRQLAGFTAPTPLGVDRSAAAPCRQETTTGRAAAAATGGGNRCACRGGRGGSG